MSPVTPSRFAVSEDDLLELWTQPAALPVLAAACDGDVEGRVVTVGGVAAVVLDGQCPQAVAAALWSLRLPTGDRPRLFQRTGIDGPWRSVVAAPAVPIAEEVACDAGSGA